jgi:outer membrane protein insertion porin family
LAACCILLLLPAAAKAANTAANTFEQKVISEIKIQGNKIVAGTDILAAMKVKTGDRVDDARLVADRDLKELWKTGKFESLNFSLVPLSDGTVRLVLAVQEKPILSEILFKGNQAYSEKELLEKSELKAGQSYDDYIGRAAAQKIDNYYKEKEYFQAEVEPAATMKPSDNKVSLVFKVKEGMKVKITKITVTGNQAFSEGKIKGVMDTKEAGWFVGGTYKEDTFVQDLKKILVSYGQEGYLKAKLFGLGLDDIDLHRQDITAKAIKVDNDKKEMTISLQVTEGPQYHLHQVTLKGNIIYSEDDLLGRMELKTGQIFNLITFEKDMHQIRTAYSEKGYIFADASPDLQYQDDAGLVDMTVDIKEGTIARVERIDIRGNTMTKDKVVRRELTLQPGEPFDTRKIQRSREKVMNLGFFEDVKVTTEPGSTPAEQVLVLEVQERQTGTISLGAGYSSVDYLMGYLQLTQANLFGNGQSVSLQWELGALRQSWQMSFTEPYLFDAPVSFGVDAWNINKNNGYNGQQYALLSQGGDVRLGRRFDELWKGYLTYKLESDNYSNIGTAVSGIKEGRSDTSAITPTMVYDSRDNIFDPNIGMYDRFSVEVAGGPLGGDNNFFKWSGESSYFYPLVWGLVLALHGNVGYAYNYDYGVTGHPDVPAAELYRVGGTDSIRGYSEGVFGSTPDNQGHFKNGGGTMEVITNVELHYPIIGPLKGVAFFDAGNTWDGFDHYREFPSLYKGVGVGIRLTIPGTVILIRFDFGYPLDQEPGKARQVNYHFNIGNIF